MIDDDDVKNFLEVGSIIALLVALIGGYWWWFIPLIVFCLV